jgi:Ca-activated chloride channel homolog
VAALGAPVSELAEFHLLRPLWLVALAPLAWLAWRTFAVAHRASAWEAVFDAELLRVQRVADPPSALWPRWAGLAAAALAVLALAGPAWVRLPQPLMDTAEARVIVLDLSRSMETPDVAPTRLVRARHAIEGLLEALPAGRVGLVAFAGSAFTVVPLTDDRGVVLHLLRLLSPGLMPVPGGDISAALRRAQQLLDDGRAIGGDVILVTDSTPDAGAEEVARGLALGGHRFWVVGVGTADGAPVPLAGGGLLKDAAGRIASPGLDERALVALAAAGRGRYERLAGEGLALATTVDWTPRQELPAAARLPTDSWRDEGRWLVLLAAPLAALAFRRGATLVACMLLLVVRPVPAADATWLDWWLRSPDQRGLAVLKDGRPELAAGTFHDARWRGYAAYRAGLYAEAADAFAAGVQADDHYNRGNALALAGRYAEAVAAYDEALALVPGMPDATFNRSVVARLVPDPTPVPLPSGGGQPVGEGGGASGRAQQHAPGQTGRERRSDGAAEGSSRGQGRAEGEGRAGGPAAGDMAERARVPGHEGTVAAPGGWEKVAPASGTRRGTGASRGRGGATQTGADDGDAARWFEQVDEGPGALLKRRFEREQARQPVAAAEPPW